MDPLGGKKDARANEKFGRRVEIPKCHRLYLPREMAFQVPSSKPVHSSRDSRVKPRQRESRADIPQLSPKPLPARHSLSGSLLPMQRQGPADCCPLSSIVAISVEVTGACRLTQENLHADPHLNFLS